MATFVSGAWNGNGTSVVVTRGTVQEGDFILGFGFCDNDGSDSSLTLPSGFGLISSSNGTGPGTSNSAGICRVSSKVATASEPSTYTFGGDASSANVSSVLIFRGVDNINPFVAGPTWSHPAAASTASLVAPTVTPTRPGTLVSGFMQEGVAGGATLSNPSGMSAGIMFEYGSFLGQLFAYQANVPASATGTKTSTASGVGNTATQGYLTVSMVLADAGYQEQLIVAPNRAVVSRASSW